MQQQTHFWPHPWGGGEGSKGQLSLNFNNKVNFKDFYTKHCVCTYKYKDKKHIEQDIYFDAWVMPQVWAWGRWGGGGGGGGGVVQRVKNFFLETWSCGILKLAVIMSRKECK